MTMEFNEWIKSTDVEIHHWNHVLYNYKKNTDSYLHEYVKKRLDLQLPLQKNIQLLANTINKSEVSILDVGSGPVPFLGRKYDKIIKLTAVDYLAESYYKLYEQYNLYPPTIPKPIDASQLSLYFDVNSFDIVYARNSIDHTFDPIKCIQEMVKVSSRYIILEHKLNEGIIENYQGLHQWNFFSKNSKFYINNKNGEEFCVNDYISSSICCKITIEEEEYIPDWLVINIEK